jgi:hypothetical protein
LPNDDQQDEVELEIIGEITCPSKHDNVEVLVIDDDVYDESDEDLFKSADEDLIPRMSMALVI